MNEPIRIGKARQMFLDGHLIEWRDTQKRVGRGAGGRCCANGLHNNGAKGPPACHCLHECERYAPSSRPFATVR